ncbi:MAG: helix-turn-helix domain-containing protein [Pontiellaceae bacterium]|nr:helix-turn-helix domain-containing protein [Pontiellaceae bacterium]
MDGIISYGRFHCGELTPHKNRGMEITYIEKGVMEWMVEGVTEKVEGGSVFFTLPWQVHGSLNPREPDNTIWHVLFHLEEDYSQPQSRFRFLKDLGFKEDEMEVMSSVFAASSLHSFRATPALRGLMPALVGELQSTHELRSAHVVTILRAVLVELKRLVAGEVTDSEIRSRSESQVKALIDRFSATCDHAWTLAEMAEQCGIQRTQFGKIFHKLTGSTPMDYLTRIRIERAKTLLRETDEKIVDVAFDCGYGSSQYFANTFRHATGISPSDFRRRCKQFSGDEAAAWDNLPFRSEDEERARVARFRNQPS